MSNDQAGQDHSEDPHAETYARGGLIAGTPSDDHLLAMLSPGCSYTIPRIYASVLRHDTDDWLRRLNEATQ